MNLESQEHKAATLGAEDVVLGIETSCDECAVAVVAGRQQHARILSDIVLSQADLHALYGGVVPEIAARAHADTIDRVAGEALKAAGIGFGDLTAVAATTGPGLLGGLLVGATFGKAVARARGLRFVAVNHLEAHVLTPRLTEGLGFPYFVALLSGGHAQFVAVLEHGQYRRLGGTIDDAAGEAFDKTAKLLGLGYPGGPAVEKAAQRGDSARFSFGIPLLKRPGCDLSFAGLKTAVRLAAQEAEPLRERDVADICAAFQATVAAHLSRAAGRAMGVFEELAGTPGNGLVVAGGVAANSAVRACLSEVAERHGVAFVAPPIKLCTDNGAMIAYAGLEALSLGTALGGDTRVRSRWPLDAQAAPMLGAGKRGVKA